MLTGSKTKFICFLPEYLLFSNFLPVSSLCISRVFAILMCIVYHICLTEWTSQVHRKWQGSPWIRWGLSVETVSCLHLPDSAVPVTRGSVPWVGTWWRVYTAVCSWPVPYLAKAHPKWGFAFVFEWLQQSNASLACHCCGLGRKTPVWVCESVCACVFASNFFFFF